MRKKDRGKGEGGREIGNESESEGGRERRRGGGGHRKRKIE